MPDNVFSRPERLRKGDTIGIVSPARYLSKEIFLKSVKVIEALGFKVKYGKGLFNKYWCFAGKALDRASQINRMFEDKSVKAIFCAQAGYGSMRVIPHLDKKLIKENPKIFMGYSDITFLLGYMSRQCKMVVFHGPVVEKEISSRMNPRTLSFMLRALMHTKPLGKLGFPHMRMIKPGKARGVILGGNISILADSIGTPCEIDTDDSILFLEDIGEDIESLDANLMKFKLAGKLKKVKGILFGRLINCYDMSGKKYSMRDVVKDILYDVDVPIIYGFPSGHVASGRETDVNVTIPFGVEVTMDSRNPSVTFHQPGVS